MSRPDPSDVLAANENLLPSIDLRAIIADFRRFLRFFIAIFTVTFLAILVPVLLQAPKYTATSSVMIDPRQMNAGPSEEVLSGLPADTITVDTETEILKSNALAERVVTSLKLDEDPEFNSVLRPAGLLSFGRTPVADEDLTPLARQARRQQVVENVLAGLSVKRQGLTRIITINYTSLSAEKSQKIANEWARLYLSQQLETKFSATQEANEWLSSKLTDMRAQVEEAETELQQYRIANNLIGTDSTSTLAQSEMSMIDQQLVQARAAQAEAEARLNVARQQLARGSTGEDLGEALNSEVIRNLRVQRATVTQRLADLESRYGPLHPDIIKTKKQLEDIDLQIQAEVKRIIANLESQAQVARQRTASLAGSSGRVRGQLQSNNQASVRLNELQRNADAASALYQSYLDRFKQTSAQEGMDKTDARIVAKANLPTGPSSPKIALSFAIALVGAGGVAVGSVLLRRALDSGLTTGTDVENILQQPFLASVPDLGSTVDKPGKSVTPVQHIKDKPLSVFAEGFRSLRAALMYSRIGDEVKVIAITSSLPGEGKTTTSVCLAQAMAMSGQKVIVLDCDLRRRSINDILKIEVETGLLEVLAGATTLSNALVSDEKTGVDFLPLAKSAYTPKDVFGTQAMDKLLASLRTQYDAIILDTAPVLPVVDTRILARKADVVAVLVRWRKTQRRAVQNSLELLEDVGANIGGVVLTQVNIKEQAKYGYGDGGYYYKQYKKYYTE